MSERSLREKTISGVVWNAVNRFAQQGIAFIVNILIARTLLPSDYGVIAMIGIFIYLAGVFIDGGFSNALIRKKDRDDDDYNTVFYTNAVISIICYLILFLSAPFIAAFYKEPILCKVTRIIGITLIFNGFEGIQNAELTIKLDFKTRTKVNVCCSIISGIISLAMAYHGFGMWSLVWQQLISCGLGCIVNWFVVKWRPKLIFSVRSFKELFSYGSKLLASNLINTLFNNITTIIVGKVYSSKDLGEYSKAGSFSNLPSGTVMGVVQSVSFPVLAEIQDQRERLERYYRLFICMSSFVLFPIMVGIAALSDPLVRFLLTDNWAGMIPMLQILCIATIFNPINSVNLNLLQVLGRSDYFLKLEIFKKIIGLGVIAITVPMGVIPMCYGRVATSIIHLGINSYYTKRLIRYGLKDQMMDILHILVHSFLMGGLVLLVIRPFHDPIVRICVGLVVGVVYYFAGAVIFKFPEIKEIKQLLVTKS